MSSNKIDTSDAISGSGQSASHVTGTTIDTKRGADVHVIGSGPHANIGAIVDLLLQGTVPSANWDKVIITQPTADTYVYAFSFEDNGQFYVDISNGYPIANFRDIGNGYYTIEAGLDVYLTEDGSYYLQE